VDYHGAEPWNFPSARVSVAGNDCAVDRLPNPQEAEMARIDVSTQINRPVGEV
jgi:hypothetical protein